MDATASDRAVEVRRQVCDRGQCYGANCCLRVCCSAPSVPVPVAVGSPGTGEPREGPQGRSGRGAARLSGGVMSENGTGGVT